MGSCGVQTVVETSVSAMLLDWHVPSGAADFLHVDLHKHQTWLLPSTVTKHLTPGVHCKGMAVRSALLMVTADLRCCQDVALRLYGSCPKKYLQKDAGIVGLSRVYPSLSYFSGLH